jgi:hypothetical protein
MQANQLLGLGYRLTTNLYLPDRFASYSYQYRLYERAVGGISRATEVYEKTEYQVPFSEEHRFILDEIRDRILQLMRETATPTQLKYLEAYLIHGSVYKCGHKNQAKVYRSLFGKKKGGTCQGLVGKVRKALRKDKVYLQLKERLLSSFEVSP